MGRSYEEKTQESRVGVIAQTVTRNNISEDRFTLRAAVPCSTRKREGLGPGNDE